MEAFAGTWKNISSEGFEEYMKASGVGLLTRKAAEHVTVTLHVTVTGNHVVCKQESAFKNTEVEFNLDEEFVETTPDGRTFKSIAHFVDGKIVINQKHIKAEDKDSVITRWIEGGQLHAELVCEGVKAHRVYEKKH